jgi:inorganic pyrophosphatase
MSLNKLTVGKNPPYDINVIIEIPAKSDPIKYELDEHSGFIKVDRFMNTSMQYPVNYGSIVGTKGGDGDMLDALVICDYSLIPGVVINVKPIGVLYMIDEGGVDEKILTVPSSKLHKMYEKINDISDISEHLLKQIKHFFEHYKDLDEGKWVKVDRFGDVKEAMEVIKKSII